MPIAPQAYAPARCAAPLFSILQGLDGALCGVSRGSESVSTRAPWLAIAGVVTLAAGRGPRRLPRDLVYPRR